MPVAPTASPVFPTPDVKVFTQLLAVLASRNGKRVASMTWFGSAASEARPNPRLAAPNEWSFSATAAGVPELSVSAHDSAGALWLKEKAAAVRSAVATLPNDQRKALELAYFSGLTQRQIAEKLSEPLGTVKARIRRALLKLRDALSPQL